MFPLLMVLVNVGKYAVAQVKWHYILSLLFCHLLRIIVKVDISVDKSTAVLK